MLGGAVCVGRQILTYGDVFLTVCVRVCEITHNEPRLSSKQNRDVELAEIKQTPSRSPGTLNTMCVCVYVCVCELKMED